jgi:Acetyl-CoA hydrolase
VTAAGLAGSRTIALEDLDFTRIVRPGDTVLWSPGVAEPVPLVERLLAQRQVIGPFTVLFAGAGYTALARPEHADTVRFITGGAVGSSRRLCAAGAAEVLPVHLSELSRLVRSGALPVDVVIAQLARDETGALSHGAASSLVGAAAARARVVVAELNEQAPWTHSRYPPVRADLVVRTSRPLIEVAARSPGPGDEAIAARVVELIGPHATVQLGIGGVPAAVARHLTSRRGLTVHSGVIGDDVVDLVESGAVTEVVTGALIGTRRLFAFAHDEPRIRVEPVSHTHEHAVLRELPAFTAVNSAIEVDLTGQVGAEVAGRAYVGTVGGQVDFVRGALASEGGRSIIALPARTRSGRPRIVPLLESGIVTTGRADADVVVTEYGVAQLRGRTIPERVRAMAAIAHPDDRDALLRAAEHVVGHVRDRPEEGPR